MAVAVVTAVIISSLTCSIHKDFECANASLHYRPRCNTQALAMAAARVCTAPGEQQLGLAIGFLSVSELAPLPSTASVSAYMDDGLQSPSSVDRAATRATASGANDTPISRGSPSHTKNGSFF